MVQPPTYSGGALMAVGKLQSQLPAYDPSNDQLAVYRFTPDTVKQFWQPTVCTVSGGKILRETYRSGGVVDTPDPAVCASGGYAVTSDTAYTFVSWYQAAIDATRHS